MDMGMVEKVTCPGMQDAYQADLSADVVRVLRQFLGRFSRSAKEQGIDQLLVGTSQLPQFRREREGQHEIGDGQEQFPLDFQPGLGLLMLAFGAMTATAGVVTVLKFPAGRAAIQLSTERFRPAALDGPHRLEMTGEQLARIFLAIGCPILAQNIGQF